MFIELEQIFHGECVGIPFSKQRVLPPEEYPVDDAGCRLGWKLGELWEEDIFFSSCFKYGKKELDSNPCGKQYRYHVIVWDEGEAAGSGSVEQDGEDQVDVEQRGRPNIPHMLHV